MKRNAPYQDEFTILADFRSDGPRAFREVHVLFYPLLVNYADRFLKDPDQAEDIVSETMVKAWERRQDFESLKGLQAFLYTVVRNACFNYLKGAKRRREILEEMGAELSYVEEIESVDAIRADLVHLSILAARDLPPQIKKVFELVYVEGFSAAEAADKLRVSIHTVRSQRATAIRRVKAALIKRGLLFFFLFFSLVLYV